MPLVAFPTYNPSNTSRPIVFICSAASANPILYAKAQFFVNGAVVANVQKAPFQEIAGTYYFQFDMKRAVAESLAPTAQQQTSVFGSLGLPYNTNNADCYADLGLVITYFYADPTTGKPTNLGITDTVPFGAYDAVIAQRQIQDDLALTAYTTPPKKEFLTNAGLDLGSFIHQDVCTEDNLFLTFIPVSDNAAQIRTFDSSGVLIDEGLIAIASTGNNEPFTLGVGVPNLNGATYYSGAVNILNPNVAYYTITTGVDSAGYTTSTEARRYNIVECCDTRKVRLHFLNRLGGADAYSFTSKKTIKERNKNDLARKPLGWDYSATPPQQIYDKGAFKINTVANKFWEVESTFYNLEEGEYLAELLTSPEVYMETPNGLQAVIVKQSEITFFENDTLIKVTATIEEVVNRFIQGN